MKITSIKYTLLCVLNLQQINFNHYQVDAISREISYPLGSILGKDYVYHVNPSQQNELSEFNSGSYTDMPKPRKIKKTYKKKHRFRKSKASNNQMSDKEKYKNKTHKKKIKRKKITKRRREEIRRNKKFIKTSLKSDKSAYSDSLENIQKVNTQMSIVNRQPVDIVVHIKMKD